MNYVIPFLLPKWRNGRRTRLKIWRQRWHEGSTPSFGTISQKLMTRSIGFFRIKVRILRNRPMNADASHAAYEVPFIFSRFYSLKIALSLSIFCSEGKKNLKKQ